MPKGRFYVADKPKDEYMNKLVGYSTYFNTLEERQQETGIDSENIVVYVDDKGEAYDIDYTSLERVEEQLGQINA